MIKKRINRAEAMKIIEKIGMDNNIHLFSDNYWAYPMDLPISQRDQKHSIMLDVMFQIEKHAGVLIYIPNKEIQEKDIA